MTKIAAALPKLDDVGLFLATAESGSFSAAARRADLAPALVSSAVMRLERVLGVRLFVRSTRSLRLSDDGERYLPHARALLAAVDGGRAALARDREAVSGLLRLSAPSDLGRNVLLPWLDAFLARHPEVRLQLRLADRVADLWRDPLDVSVRYGELADSTLVSLPLMPENRRVLCASPDYLARHGVPGRPEDLTGHNCLRYVMGGETHDRWRFEWPGGPRVVTVQGDRVSDDADVVRRWAVAGHGLVYKSRLDLTPDLVAGRLVPCFPLQMGERTPLALVSADRALLTPLVRRLREHLLACCRALG